MSEGDESLYGIVAKELSADRRSEALWTKAFALANGEEAATRAMYIRLRVEQLNVRRLSGTSPKVPAPVRAADAATGVGVVGAGATEPAHAEPGKTATTATLTTEELYRAAIGPKNQAFYLDYFARADAAGKMLPSWNWPAFFVSFIWLLYRKLWGWAALYAVAPFALGFITGFIEGLTVRLVIEFGGKAPAPDHVVSPVTLAVGFIAWFIVLPCSVNGLYHRHIRKKCLSAREKFEDPQERLAWLARKGGTSPIAATLAAIWTAISMVWIIAAIAIPAYQDYVKHAEHSLSTPSSPLANGPIWAVCTGIFTDMEVAGCPREATQLVGTWDCQPKDARSGTWTSVFVYNADGTMEDGRRWQVGDDQFLYEQSLLSGRPDGYLKTRIDWTYGVWTRFDRTAVETGKPLYCKKRGRQ